MAFGLLQTPSICEAPAQVARDLLYGEGFAEVQYVKVAASSDGYKASAEGEAHMGLLFAGGLVMRIDAGDPLVLLGGIHVGCFELFGSERVRHVRDLKGKTVAVPALGSSHHICVASMAAYVGLDPRTDMHWAIQRGPDAMQLLAEGQIDGLLGFLLEPQELRAKKIGHVVVDTRTDRPWSQYFCCMRRCPITNGASMIPRTPCAFTPPASKKQGCSRGRPRRSSLRALRADPTVSRACATRNHPDLCGIDGSHDQGELPEGPGTVSSVCPCIAVAYRQ